MVHEVDDLPGEGQQQVTHLDNWRDQLSGRMEVGMSQKGYAMLFYFNSMTN